MYSILILNTQENVVNYGHNLLQTALKLKWRNLRIKYAMEPDTGVEPVLNEYESFVLPIYESGTRASYVNRTHIPGVQNPCTSHCTKEAQNVFYFNMEHANIYINLLLFQI